MYESIEGKGECHAIPSEMNNNNNVSCGRKHYYHSSSSLSSSSFSEKIFLLSVGIWIRKQYNNILQPVTKWVEWLAQMGKKKREERNSSRWLIFHFSRTQSLEHSELISCCYCVNDEYYLIHKLHKYDEFPIICCMRWKCWNLILKRRNPEKEI